MASLRYVFRVSLCAVALFACTAPLAHAGLVSGLLPGLVSPADTPTTCNTSSSQAFAKVDGDTSNYVLAPGGSIGAWLTGLSGMIVTLFAMIIATIPPPDMGDALLFRLKVIGGALGFILIGGLIYWRARLKRTIA